MVVELTGILGIFRAHILVARIQDILIHQRCPRRHLPEEADFDRFANLDALSFLHEDLPCVFAPVLAVETGHTVLFGVVAFFEGLKGSHQVVTTGNAGGNDTLRDTGCDGAFDDGSNGVHGANDFGLELRGDVEFDLLEKVFGGTEATDNEDVLEGKVSKCARGLNMASTTYLEHSVLSLDCNDLVPYKLQDAVHHRLKALKDFFVGKCHVTFFDPSIWELCFNADIDSPLLAVISEIRLDSVFEIHYTLCVHSTGCFRSIWQFHLANLCAQDITEVAV